MESLLLCFLSVLIAECGDRPQLLSAALSVRFRREYPIILGVTCAALANSLIAAYVGSFMHNMISEDPVRLFTGLAYILGGISMLLWRRSVNLLERWKTGPFFTAFLGIFMLQFGDKGQFIVLANAANGEAWLLSAMGGWLGALIAIIPAIAFKEKLGEIIPLVKIRTIGATVFLLYGAVLALGAWRLI